MVSKWCHSYWVSHKLISLAVIYGQDGQQKTMAGHETIPGLPPSAWDRGNLE
jgi:hypothetical protein